jgi:hypothetical protein
MATFFVSFGAKSLITKEVFVQVKNENPNSPQVDNSYFFSQTYKTP